MGSIRACLRIAFLMGMVLPLASCGEEALTRSQAEEILKTTADSRKPVMVVSLRYEIWIPDEITEDKASRQRVLRFLTELMSEGLLEARQVRRLTLDDRPGTAFLFRILSNEDVKPDTPSPFVAEIVLTRSQWSRVTGIVQEENYATVLAVQRQRPTRVHEAIARALKASQATGGDLRIDPWAMRHVFPRGFPKTDPAETVVRTITWTSFSRFDDGWRFTQVLGTEGEVLLRKQGVGRPRIAAEKAAEPQPDPGSLTDEELSRTIQGYAGSWY